MAPANPAITQPSDEPGDNAWRCNDPAMQHAVRRQLQAQWQDVLPPAEQEFAIAVLCGDPVMQAYIERAAQVLPSE